MIRTVLFVTFFVSLLSCSFALEGAAPGADSSSFAPVSSRSLESKKETRVAGLEGWKITASNRGGVVSCRGEMQLPNGDELTLIFDPVGKYAGGAWYLAVVHRKFSLSEGAQIPALLQMDGKTREWGKILDVGDSQGGVRTASYVRAEFQKLDDLIPGLKSAKTVSIRAKGVEGLEISLPSLTRVIEILEKSHADATGPESNTFWKDATTTCN
jgi:hypothetical protein